VSAKSLKPEAKSPAAGGKAAAKAPAPQKQAHPAGAAKTPSKKQQEGGAPADGQSAPARPRRSSESEVGSAPPTGSQEVAAPPAATTAVTAPSAARLGRNDPCHCGSGKKYKHCHLAQDEAEARAAREKAAEAEVASAPEAPPEEDAGKTAARPPRPVTHQPWKKAALYSGFHQKVRTPRKVGGS
jgi:hypothetical protein